MSTAPDRLRVGGYALGERIGTGRIARVYRAGAEGELAVKLLAPDAELDDPAAAARFRHEVEAMSRLRHPNVIPLIDHGVDDELGPYLVMPFVPGRTLRALFADGRIEPAVAALAAREIAAGLAALHDAGLVHRDLKPENVMITVGGGVVILDLGLAWAESQTRHTEEGSVAGSVPYMAPEQIDGGAPAPSTDLWALAVMVHEWIAGTRPFARDRQSAEVAAILGGRFTPLCERDPRVPAELGAAIDACLRPAGRRPPRGSALAAELARLAPGDSRVALADPAASSAAEAERGAAAAMDEARRELSRGKPFTAAAAVERAAAHKPNDPEVLALAEEVGRTPPRARRSRLWWLGGLAVGLAAVGAVAFALGGSGDGGDPDEEPAAAVADPSEPDAGPAGPSLDPGALPEETEPDRASLASLVTPRHQMLIPYDEEVEVNLAHSLGRGYMETADDPDEHVKSLRAILRSTRKEEALEALARAAERYPDHAAIQNLAGRMALRTGKPEEAEAAFGRAIDGAPDDPEGYRERARVRRLRGRLRGSYRDLERAYELAPDDPAVLHELVALHLAVDAADRARPLALRATELDPESARAWIDLAAVSPDAEAVDYLQTALRYEPRSARAYRDLCLVQARLGHPRAEKDCFQAKVYNRGDPDVHLAAARAYENQGDIERARSELFGATVTIEDDVRLFVRLAELEKKLGYDYALPKTYAKACALGHQPSCEAAAPDAGVE